MVKRPQTTDSSKCVQIISPSTTVRASEVPAAVRASRVSCGKALEKCVHSRQFKDQIAVGGISQLNCGGLSNQNICTAPGLQRIAAQSQKTQEDAAIRERVQQHALEISKNLNDYLAEKSNTVEALVISRRAGETKASAGALLPSCLVRH